MVEQRKDCYSHSSSSVELCARGGSLFSWDGVLTFGGIDAILGEVSALLAAQGVGEALRNRVRHILIELLENAHRYGHTHDGEAAPWIGMQVGVGEHGSILLEVANRVLPAQRAFLEGYLSRLQQMGYAGVQPYHSRKASRGRGLNEGGRWARVALLRAFLPRV